KTLPDKAFQSIPIPTSRCVRVLEHKVRLQYKKLSPEVIRYELQKLQVSILKDEKTHKQYVLPSRASQHAKKILEALGYKWNDTPYPIPTKPPK
ncbi:hypothetical protein C7N43_29875, partial [Sphingobacteriales bacterium UPWRP_1]